MTVDIPASVVEQLKGLLSSDELAGSQISFELKVIASEDFSALLKQAGGKEKVELKVDSQVMEFNLSVIDKNGKQTKLSAFSEPITLSLKVSGDVNKDLLGIYCVSGDSSLEYFGGKMDAGKMLANISHFSKIAVLEYNKSFTDVSADFWATDLIKLLAAKHIVKGG